MDMEVNIIFTKEAALQRHGRPRESIRWQGGVTTFPHVGDHIVLGRGDDALFHPVVQRVFQLGEKKSMVLVVLGPGSTLDNTLDLPDGA